MEKKLNYQYSSHFQATIDVESNQFDSENTSSDGEPPTELEPCFLDRKGYVFQRDEAHPIIKHNYDMRYDIKLGWKPSDFGPSGAPIPLRYNFDLHQLQARD